MRIVFITLFLILISLGAQGQPLSTNDLLGSWKTVRIIRMEEESSVSSENRKEVAAFKAALLKSKFIFKAGQQFSFEISINEISIKKGRWIYNATKKIASVQEWNDKRSILMNIIPSRQGDKVIFIIDEVGTFEVSKE